MYKRGLVLTGCECVPRLPSANWMNDGGGQAVRVSELMSRDVVTIGDTETCHEAVEQMCRRKVRHLPVLDREGALVGTVTDRDVRHRLFAPDVYRQIGRVPLRVLLQQAPVRAVMSAPVPRIGTASDVAEAAARMRQERVGCLPVVEGSHVVGMLTEIDILRHIARAESPESVCPRGRFCATG
jgi:CBS domain-containing protein